MECVFEPGFSFTNIDMKRLVITSVCAVRR